MLIHSKPNIFRILINHLQGASGTSRNQQYMCNASYVRFCENNVKNKYIKTHDM
jgi:hypothetical protein